MNSLNKSCSGRPPKKVHTYATDRAAHCFGAQRQNPKFATDIDSCQIRFLGNLILCVVYSRETEAKYYRTKRQPST